MNLKRMKPLNPLKMNQIKILQFYIIRKLEKKTPKDNIYVHSH